MVRYFVAIGWVLFAFAEIASAQISYPMIMGLKPVAVQVGTTAECEVHSRYTLFGTHQIFITGTGVYAEPIPPDAEAAKNPQTITKLKLKITADPEALPGVREFRLATPTGASTVGQLVIVRDPVIAEKADNDVKEKAQDVVLPATLCGTIEKAEDADFYKFRAQAGQALSFHVRSQRLQDKIHDLQEHSDPILFLRDAAGGLLAMSDNTFFADPFLAYQFTTAGDYLLEIRDVRYKGNAYWEYSIEANARPFVANVFPLALNLGTETTVEPAGWNFPAGAKVKIALPGNGQPPVDYDRPADASTPGLEHPIAGTRYLTWSPLSFGDQPSQPVPVLATDLPIVAEAAGENNDPQTALTITVPAVVNGRMEVAADLDCYSFAAKKGEKLNFEVFARRAQSQLDPILRVMNAEGAVLREEDDFSYGKTQSTSDARLEGWEAPADGTYFVDLRDAHLRGGSGFPYALAITHTQPYFELLIDTDKTQLTPGTYGVLFVRAKRMHGFAGEVQLHIDNLPPGVTAYTGKILGGKGLDGAIVLEAPAGTPLAATNVRIWGTAAHPQGEGRPPLELTAEAQPFQETYNPGGGRNFYAVETHAVNVGAPADLLGIEVSETDLQLKPGETKTIGVKLKRAENMKHNVTLDMQFTHLEQVFASSLPEGVTINRSAGKTLLTGMDSEGAIELKVDAAAPPVEKQLGAVMANISINFVMKATYSSAPIYLTIDKTP
jgi:hypothetical protein